MNATKIQPICACCREPITMVWRVTWPEVFVLCGSGGCERWAWAQGLTFYGEGTMPRRAPRRHGRPRCDGCGAEIPKGHTFRDGKRPFCTLTCMNRHTRPAPSRSPRG